MKIKHLSLILGVFFFISTVNSEYVWNGSEWAWKERIENNEGSGSVPEDDEDFDQKGSGDYKISTTPTESIEQLELTTSEPGSKAGRRSQIHFKLIVIAPVILHSQLEF